MYGEEALGASLQAAAAVVQKIEEGDKGITELLEKRLVEEKNAKEAEQARLRLLEEAEQAQREADKKMKAAKCAEQQRDDAAKAAAVARASIASGTEGVGEELDEVMRRG